MADFVIIGGGGYGAGVAWELARRGADVHLLEAKKIASGASGGLGKRGVRANGRDLRELPLMKRAYELWPTLHQQLGEPVGYERNGHLLLIERERDLAPAEAMQWMQNQQGIQSEWVNREWLQEIEPEVSRNILAAVHCPLDGIADHTATTKGYARAAAKLGAVIQENSRVYDFERPNGKITAVFSENGERIPVAKKVLLLSNAHVPGFLEEQFGVNLPVWEMLPQVMLTDPLDPMPVRHLIGHWAPHPGDESVRKPDHDLRRMARPRQRQNRRNRDDSRTGRRQSGRSHSGLPLPGRNRHQTGRCQSPRNDLNRWDSHHRYAASGLKYDLCHGLVRPWLGHHPRGS